MGKVRKQLSTVLSSRRKCKCSGIDSEGVGILDNQTELIELEGGRIVNVDRSCSLLRCALEVFLES